jgi:DNA-binding GntR family transcriptional regulator
MNQYLSLKEHVYNYIAEKINQGSITPEERISEQLICEELNVSRTPVREALIQLAAEGYLESLPRRGFIVRRIDEKKARDLYKIIGALDGMAATLSMDYITEKEIFEMKNLIKSMDKALADGLLDVYYRLQIEFHNVYINVCDNEDIIRLLNQLRKNFIKQTYSDKGSEDIFEVVQKTHSQHSIIVEIFEKRDKKEIERYLKDVHWNVDNAKFDSI